MSLIFDFIIFTLLFITNNSVCGESKAPLLNAVYWEEKPFIFTAEDGSVDGIIPEMLRNGELYCKQQAYIQLNKSTASMKPLVAYYKLPSWHMFHGILHQNVSIGEGLLKNVSYNGSIWIPYVGTKKNIHHGYLAQKKLKSFQLFTSNHVAVIVPRSLISLPNKIMRGLLACEQIFLISVLLSFIFGSAVWLIERQFNEEFPKPFYKGIATGLWWSVVSMSTVGYGDVVPRKALGRFVAFFWLVLGVLAGCLLTATMSDFVSGIGDLGVYDRYVAVLENSNDEKVAAFEYGAKVIPAKSYVEVLELVRHGKVFAGVMNADVAAWYQKRILDDSLENPLRIIQLLPGTLHINCFINVNVDPIVKEMFKCMHKLKDEVYYHPVEEFRRNCHTETLYIGSTIDLFHENTFLQVLFSIFALIMVAGLVFDGYTSLTGREGKGVCIERMELTSK